MKRYIIFCDFDGTFAEKDIGHHLYTHFSGGRNLPLVEKWKNGEISMRECMLGEAALARAREGEMHDFLDRFRLRDGAHEIVREAEKNEIPFYILSDGSDIYIEYLLKKYGLSTLKYFSNHIEIDEDRLVLTFPYTNVGCERCGSCKGERIKEVIDMEQTNPEVVFIGDGLSDLCAIPESDIIFARGDLLTYCRSRDIMAIDYKDFFDILNRLKELGVIRK